MKLNGLKLVILILLTLGFVSITVADLQWRMNPVDEPFSLNQTGVNTTTIQLVKLTYEDPNDDTAGWKPLTYDDINWSRSSVSYYYNKSNGSSSQLNHLRDSYWYATFKPNFTRGNLIKYNASGYTNLGAGAVGSDGTTNVTEDLNVGDLKITNESELQDWYKADRNIKIEAQVTNSSNNNIVSNSTGSVTVSFANESGQAASYTLNNYNDNENYFFNSEVTTPKATNSTFFMHIEASRTSGIRPHGTYTKVIHTYPAIQGEITEFSSEKDCDDSEMVEECDQEAELDLEYNITAAAADSVNLSVYAFNNSGRHEIKNMSLTREGSLFNGSFKVPDINTSKYKKEIEFKFNASNDARTHIDRRNITVNSFDVERAGALTTSTGENYELKLSFRKPYSLESLNKSRFNKIEVNITDADDNNLTNYTIEDLEYDSVTGTMQKELLIEADAPTGRYDIDVNAKNIYNETKTSNFRFRVRDIDATFDIEDTTFQVNTLYSQNFTTHIVNDINQENNITTDTSDLPDEIRLVNESITLGPEANESLMFEINLTDIQDVSGDLNLEGNQSGFNDTIEITADAPTCPVAGERLCSTTGEIDVEINDEDNPYSFQTIDILHLGPPGEKIQFNTSITGNISNLVEFTGEKTGINITDSKEIGLNYTGSQEGNFTGKIHLATENETIKVNTSLESNVSTGQTGNQQEEDSPDLSLSIDPSSVDLGYLESGESASADVTVTNEGEDEAANLEATSTEYTVSINSESIPAGEEADLTINFEDVTSGSGEVSIEAVGGSTTLTVSANPVENRASDLRDRKSRLQTQVESGSTAQQDLTELSAQISSYETSISGGNYEEAQETYQEIDSKLDRISRQTTTSPSGNTGEDNEDSSGGLPILPIAGGVIVIVLIVFVVYESYIPEEGDPLYSVLGE